MNVAIIGATGRLAPVVVSEMIRSGFAVRALVRNAEKATALLPKGVEIVAANLEDVRSLKAGLTGANFAYLNLSTTEPHSRFQPELDGVRNILDASVGSGIQRIFKISGLGAFRKDFNSGKTIFVNEIRLKGHYLIQQSGIPYTFFHPSWFMESLELMFRKGNVLQAFKPIRHPIHWIAGADYAKMVVRAVQLGEAAGTDYVMQGPEAVTMHDALVRYSRTFTPALRVSETPIGLVKLLGMVNARLKLVGMMGEYFKDFKEEFIAEETWQALGKPIRTIENFRD